MTDKAKPATVMLMMDGKLLVANFLLATLAKVAADSLGHTADLVREMSYEERLMASREVSGLVHKMSVHGLRGMLASETGPMGWDEIRIMAQAVVDEVNA